MDTNEFVKSKVASFQELHSLVNVNNITPTTSNFVHGFTDVLVAECLDLLSNDDLNEDTYDLLRLLMASGMQYDLLICLISMAKKDYTDHPMFKVMVDKFKKTSVIENKLADELLSKTSELNSISDLITLRNQFYSDLGDAAVAVWKSAQAQYGLNVVTNVNNTIH